jgi:hypothetical protein
VRTMDAGRPSAVTMMNDLDQDTQVEVLGVQTHDVIARRA